jgi:hypothetical protein
MPAPEQTADGPLVFVGISVRVVDAAIVAIEAGPRRVQDSEGQAVQKKRSAISAEFRR